MSQPNVSDRPLEPWKPMAARSAVCAVGALFAWFVHDRNHDLSTALFMISYLAGGWDLALAAWRDLRQVRFDTDFLMLLVAPAAIAVGAWGEGALLLVLFSASAAMEEFAAGRTRREISALLRGAPKSARLLAEGGEYEVTVESLQPGQLIRVTAGEQVPVDFRVSRGTSACDESMLTGESEPVTKGAGDLALAGTLNQWGVLEGRVLRVAGDSALQRIIRLIQSAQHLKAPVQRFTDRFGTGYTVFVIGVCAAMFLFWWRASGAPPFFSTDSAQSAFYRAMTLLTVMSPCALVLSVPSAILSAIAYGARHGVLFRGGAAVEKLAEVTTVAMDKTGTLTEGALQVLGVEVVRGNDRAILRAAGSLARLSNHPVSRAIAREAVRRGLELDELEAAETVPGKGIRAVGGGVRFALGNREMLMGEVPEETFTELPALPENTTETWVSGDGLLGRLLLRDQLRRESRGLIERLHAEGLRTVMLTGDRANAAARIALESGVQEVLSGLKPEQKVAAIQKLKQDGARVAMIGDGVNDAPCLAAADVGVAMGARGSDAALEQAEVILMHDRLENFLLARDLSLRARRIIRQNLSVSLGTMGAMALITIITPHLPLSIGVAAHEGSTVLVVLNSLRLLLRPRASAPTVGATTK